jgi:hypothetical protein
MDRPGDRPPALALDEDPTLHIYVQLTTDARSIAQQSGADQFHGHSAITLTFTLAPGNRPRRPTSEARAGQASAWAPERRDRHPRCPASRPNSA